MAEPEIVPAPTPAPAPVPAPTFDPKLIQDAVRTSIEGFVTEARAKQAEAEAIEAAKVKPTGMDEMFRPHLEPALAAARNAEARANLAADAAEFYTDAKNAVAMEFRPKIEETVMAQAKRGNLISRKDAWNWLRGGELYDERGKRSETAHEAKIKAAQEAATAGAGVGPATRITKPLDDMKTDELGEALRGVRF